MCIFTTAALVAAAVTAASTAGTMAAGATVLGMTAATLTTVAWTAGTLALATGAMAAMQADSNRKEKHAEQDWQRQENANTTIRNSSNSTDFGAQSAAAAAGRKDAMAQKQLTLNPSLGPQVLGKAQPMATLNTATI